MLLKTHIIVTLFFILILLSYVNDRIIFIFVSLFSAILPDIDSRFSKIGQKRISRILQFFTKHRGIIHSYTLLLIITMIFVLFIPLIALPFFLGYGLHLLADSFTLTGIKPFYPFKKQISGKIKTGGKFEKAILVLFGASDLVIILTKIFSIF